MKIEWLDGDLTKARVTRGWFSKQSALVYCKHDEYWYYTATNRRASSIEERLKSARWDAQHERAAAKEWEDVKPLPVARILK